MKKVLKQLEVVAGWAPLVCLLMLLAISAKWMDIGLRHLGLSEAYWQSAMWWWAAGLVCSFGWPVRYWRGMKGLWRDSLSGILMTSLTGPFALVLGYPL